MATWPQLREYLQQTYKHEPMGENGGLRMLFDVGEGRSQVVVVEPARLRGDEENEDWAIIESPIGDVASVDIRAIVREIATNVCGGLSGAVHAPDVLALRHAVPLANVDLNEFERPMRLLLFSADRLERDFVGGDRF